MSETAGGASTVAVVGDDGGVADALAAAGARTVTGEPADALAAEPGVLVAVGERALLAVARERPSVPLVPVDAGRGVRSVPAAAVESVADRLVAGDWTTETHPLLGVATPEWTGMAFLDAMLVTADPADISEYTVTAGGETVARFRSDGVVAATPAGTPGYARAAGGPVVSPGRDVLALVPVAPFARDSDHWVLPLDDVTVVVERDEAAVEVMADDRTVGPAVTGVPVELSRAGDVEVVRVPEGRSPYGPSGAELEKL